METATRNRTTLVLFVVVLDQLTLCITNGHVDSKISRVNRRIVPVGPCFFELMVVYVVVFVVVVVVAVAFVVIPVVIARIFFFLSISLIMVLV